MAFKALQKHYQAYIYTSFLFQIINGDSFGKMVVSAYFPDLREEINHRGFRKASAGQAQASSTETQNQYKTVQCDSDSIRTKLTSYKKVALFLDDTTEQYKIRLDSRLNHTQTSMNKRKAGEPADGGTKDKKVDYRGRCVLCCWKCDANKCKPMGKKEQLYCEGKKTAYYCPVCKVHLCDKCHVAFHTEKRLTLPACSPYLRLAQRGNTSGETGAERSNNLRVTRRRNPVTPEDSNKKIKRNPDPFV